MPLPAPLREELVAGTVVLRAMASIARKVATRMCGRLVGLAAPVCLSEGSDVERRRATDFVPAQVAASRPQNIPLGMIFKVPSAQTTVADLCRICAALTKNGSRRSGLSTTDNQVMGGALGGYVFCQA